jgi:hypothetical protein
VFPPPPANGAPGGPPPPQQQHQQHQHQPPPPHPHHHHGVPLGPEETHLSAELSRLARDLFEQLAALRSADATTAEGRSHAGALEARVQEGLHIMRRMIDDLKIAAEEQDTLSLGALIQGGGSDGRRRRTTIPR